MRATLKAVAILAFALMAAGAPAAQPARHNPVLTRNSMINLYDAFGSRKDLHYDFGFSTIINYRGKVILFDAGGHADHFAANVKKLGVDLKKIDIVVISHAHPDHLNGLDYLLTVHPRVKIYFPEDIFYGTPAVFDATGTEAGVSDSLPEEMRYYKKKDLVVQSGRFWKADIEYVKENREILPGLRLVTTTSPYMGYFLRYPRSFLQDHFQTAPEGASSSDARLIGLNELSLSMATDEGEVLVVGCSHSSVEKIIAAAKAYTKKEMALVFGGFHMIPFSRKEIEAVAQHIKNDLGVKKLAPAHCTGQLAFKVLRDLYGADYIIGGAGTKIPF